LIFHDSICSFCLAFLKPAFVDEVFIGEPDLPLPGPGQLSADGPAPGDQYQLLLVIPVYVNGFEVKDRMKRL